jgi:putative membrane protein
VDVAIFAESFAGRNNMMRFVRCLAPCLSGALVFIAPAAQAAVADPTAPVPSSAVRQLAGAGEVSQQDQQYLKETHQGFLTELKAGWLAVDKGNCAAIRRVGAVLVRDHSQLDTQLRQVADRANVGLPTEPNVTQRAQLDKVGALSGREFDRAWLDLVLTVNRDGLRIDEQELRDGHSSEVKDLVLAASPIDERHVSLLRAAKETCQIG